MLEKAVVLLLLACAASASVVVSPTPIELTADTFDDTVSTGKHLVMFYADWCGVCKMFKPTFEQLATRAHTKHPEMQLSKVNIDDDTGIGARFQVEVIPTLFMIDNGVVYQYTGQLDITQVAAFMDDYMDKQPWTGIMSPLGIVPKAVGVIVQQAIGVWRYLQQLQDEQGIPTYVSLPVLAVAVLTAAVAFALVLNLCLGASSSSTAAAATGVDDKDSASGSSTATSGKGGAKARRNTPKSK